MTNVDGIWDIEYVRKLGILDHCKELIIINDEITRQKNCSEFNYHDESLENHFNKECADLFLILAKQLKLSIKFEENKNIFVNEYNSIILARRLKFEEKKND